MVKETAELGSVLVMPPVPEEGPSPKTEGLVVLVVPPVGVVVVPPVGVVVPPVGVVEPPVGVVVPPVGVVVEGGVVVGVVVLPVELNKGERQETKQKTKKTILILILILITHNQIEYTNF